ncbi:opsin 8, group member c isoform X1 [Takifugu rubripes]|uniref:Opsin-5 n=1 Tax=Takifugu rubripes TaxID=31033 RepID=H2V9X2_TAKRU|nr:opsin-5-like isoform X1 [Takifugu rubripes]
MNCCGDNRTVSAFASKLTPAADICVGLTILTVVLLSVLGNGLVLVICYHRRRKLVGSELLCVNLAAVDFLCCICFYPLSILSSFRHAWVGESATCVYYGFGCFVFGLCSMFTITAISVLRYLKTCYSLVYAVWMKGGNIWIVCCCIWLVATVWSSFPLFGWGEYVPEPYGLSCTVAWRGYHTSTKDAFYVICSFTCFTLIPVLLIVVSQCQIISRVSRFSYRLSARGICNNLQSTEKRLSMMFFCISLGFVIAWAPYTVVSFLFIFHKGNHYMAPGGFVFAALFAKSSHIYNPFIYFYFNKTFQKEFRHLFFNLWHKRGGNRVGIRFTVGQENAHPIDIQFQERDSPRKKTSVSQDRSQNRSRSKDEAEDGGIKPVYTCWDFTLDNTRLIMENKPPEDPESVRASSP